jgi:hypothetical protein
MNRTDLLDRLKISQGSDATAPHWEDSVATLPAQTLPFFRPDVVRRHGEYARLDADLVCRLVKAAQRFDRDDALRLMAWHTYRCVFVHTDTDLQEWPRDIPAIGGDAGLLYLLCALAMIPLTIQKHRTLFIPEAVTRDTCLVVSSFNLYHMTGYGRPGILVQHFPWMRKHPAGELFRLGRFEYQRVPQHGKVRLWRHRQSRRPILFMPPDRWYDEEGFGVFPDDPRARLLSVWDEDDTRVTGTAASPRGTAIPEPVTIDKVSWERVLGPDDPVLDMHIPAGGGMTLKACEHSLRAAFEFFDRHVGAVATATVFCESWIFNTQLEEWLPDSNLTRFMRELYLYPRISSGNNGLNFVFVRDYDDWSQAPHKTRLQRALLDHYCNGTPLRCGGMVFLREDLDQFGTQVYRRLALLQPWPPGSDHRFL